MGRYNLHIRRLDNFPSLASSNMDSLVPGGLEEGREPGTHTHTVPSMLSTSFNTAGIDDPGLDLGLFPIHIDPPGQDFSSFSRRSFDDAFADIGPVHCNALRSSGPRYGLTFDEFSAEASSSSTDSPRSNFQYCTGQNPASLAWVGNQETSHDKPTRLQKTTFTMDNLDSETRAEILDILCKRRVSTTIAVKD